VKADTSPAPTPRLAPLRMASAREGVVG